jgi:RNA recognition motif-containing protein
MGTNLYVGNLSFETGEGDLLTLFQSVAQVTRCSLIMDKYTNRSRGFAFVEMASQDDANKAIAELNGKEFQGRALTVNEAKPREERPRRDFGGGGGGGGGGRRDFGGGGGGGRRDFGGGGGRDRGRRDFGGGGRDRGY